MPLVIGSLALALPCNLARRYRKSVFTDHDVTRCTGLFENNWLIEIYEGRFVGIIYSAEDEPSIYGDLRNEGTRFVSWFPFHRQTQVSSATEEIAQRLLPNKIGDFVPKWEDPVRWSDRLDPDFLDYEYEDHDSDGDPLVIAAEATARSPLFKTTVNVTLAIRKTLRRYLGIEPAGPASEMRQCT